MENKDNPDIAITLPKSSWQTLLSAADCGMLDLDPEWHRSLMAAMDHIEKVLNAFA